LVLALACTEIAAKTAAVDATTSLWLRIKPS